MIHSELKIERIWAMPSKKTFLILPIRKLLEEELKYPSEIIDPFSRNSLYANFSNDIDPNTAAKFHMDAIDFLAEFPNEIADFVLYDPPYSMRQASECYNSYGKDKLSVSVTSMKYWSSVKNELSRVLKPGGKAICCGWSSMGLGKKRGFEMNRILLVPHGGSRNDTILTVEKKYMEIRNNVDK